MTGTWTPESWKAHEARHLPSYPDAAALAKELDYDPEKAKALLKEAGVATPLNVTLTLPPPQYARKGGEVVAAMLAKVGVVAKIENVEWAQWLGGTFKGNFDLTIINHVEPLDYVQYANPDYYWGYNSPAFNALVKKRAEAARHQASSSKSRGRRKGRPRPSSATMLASR